MIVLVRNRLKPYIPQFDKMVMTKLLFCDDPINETNFKSILDIENLLLIGKKSLYPLEIVLGVSRYYQISVFDIIGKVRRDEKVRKARKVMIYMLDFKASDLINHSDIARIMKRTPSSTTINYAIKSVVNCLPDNRGGLKADIVAINKNLIERKY